MESVLLGNLLTVMIFLSLPAVLPVVIKPYGDNRFGPSAKPMAFAEAITTASKRMFDFNGRASRSEFWWNALIYWGGYILLAIVARQTGNALLGQVALVLFLPLIAVGARRLHDINRTGWWWLIAPIGLGAVAFIVLLAWPSQKESA